MRRIFYFLATNAAIMFVVAIVVQFLPAEYQNQDGQFLVFALVAGFGGSIFSLLMSKSMAKRMTGLQVIEQPRNQTEQWLLSTVARQAQAAGIGMPEVGIFAAHEMNAFATGANRNNALVAVSTGLLENMSKDEVEAVLGHEIAHAELRHSIKQLERQYGISLLLQIATGQNPGALAQVATALGQLKFSRSAESESDAASVTYLSSSPYRCDGAAGFFKKMQEQGGGAAPPEFLSTHPAPANRIQAIENKAKEVGCKTTPYNPTSFDSFKKWLP